MCVDLFLLLATYGRAISVLADIGRQLFTPKYVLVFGFWILYFDFDFYSGI
jgi:hypothetical protein